MLTHESSAAVREAAQPAHDVRREAILEAVARLFKEHGYDATSVRDIARAAGISQATLYYYIGSKQDALVAIYNAAMDAKLDQVLAVARSTARPAEKLRAFVRAELRSIDHDHNRWAIIQRERNSLPPDAQTQIQVKRDQVDGVLTQILEEGIAAGMFRSVPVKSARMAILGMINRAADWYSPGGPTSAEEFAADFCDLIFHGLLPHQRGDDPAGSLGA